LAFLEPLRYISRYFYWVLFTASGATELPFELPGHGELLEVARRFDIYSTFNRVASTYMFRGLPYWYISYMAEVPQTPYISIPVPALDEYRREMQSGFITVVDRFGNTRMFPLSPLFRLPTESDLVHFMLRDLFLPLTQNPAQAPPLALKSFLEGYVGPRGAAGRRDVLLPPRLRAAVADAAVELHGACSLRHGVVQAA